MGELRIMTAQGDETLRWDPDDSEQVKEAKKRFAELKKDGFEAYEVSETKGRKIARFDKKLGRVIMAPGARKPAERKTGRRTRAMGGGPTNGPHVRLNDDDAMFQSAYDGFIA